MSGLCGIWAFDAPAPDIGVVLSNMRDRGPDRETRYSEDNVAIGHALLATTPESLHEKLPYRDGSSGCVITADVRLDNRAELLLQLRLVADGRMIGDGEIVLRSYLHWGLDCPKHLLGDFAFAIWDPRNKQFFCARDHMGVRTFNYHFETDRIFAFASDAESLSSHPEVPKILNDGRVIDYLAGLEAIDFTSTFFDGIFRLPPAHSLIVSRDELVLQRYWKLEAPSELKLASDEDYERAFFDVFREAVRCRLRSAKPVASMLSGGLDSSSVAAIASSVLSEAGLAPLHTVSAIGPSHTDCAETRAIMSAGQNPGFEAHFIVSPDRCDDLSQFLPLPRGTEPFDGHMTLMRGIYKEAGRLGFNVVLDGGTGDVALTPGNRIAHLLRRGDPLRAIEEACFERAYWRRRTSVLGLLAGATWAAFVPGSVRRWRRHLFVERFSPDLKMMEFIDDDRLTQAQLRERRRRLASHMPVHLLSLPSGRAASICHPNTAVGNERYNRVASAYGVEPRDPFLDIRVLVFCLSLPNEQLQAHGWPKFILRRAMEGFLPEEVRWRIGKEHLGKAYTDGLRERWAGWRSKLVKGANNLRLIPRWEFVSTEDNHLPKGMDSETQFNVFFLLDWLERVGPNRSAL